MSIDEIKAELELRGVDYQDCISKNELVQRLVETRVSGKANPDILKSMQTQSSDDILISELDDDVLDQATAKDGNLPGGMSKDMLKALSKDPEIMRMLKDPKMQDIMGAVMTGGPDAIKKYLSDPGSWYFWLLDELSDIIITIYHYRFCRCANAVGKTQQDHGQVPQLIVSTIHHAFLYKALQYCIYSVTFT